MNSVLMAQATQANAKPKFGGQQTLLAKVQPCYPSIVEREYVRVVNSYMALLYTTMKEELPAIRKAIRAERDADYRDANSHVQSVIQQTFSNIQVRFDSAAVSFDLKQKLEKIANLNQSVAIADWKRVVSATLGIDLLDEYYIGEFFRWSKNQWIDRNANLMRAIPLNAMADMYNTVQDAYTAASSNAEISKALIVTYGLKLAYARFVARYQTTKLNAELTRAQQKDAGVSKYVWISARDERVRLRHSQLDGQTFSWSDPPIINLETGRRGHPGDDYQCRCIASPIFSFNLSLPYVKK